ncbi:MAG: glycosyltransferase family 4 protein [Anaerolineae bacterium]|nr:glycosyltransferase family 4 protein [Anaerolineae bacterium]
MRIACFSPLNPRPTGIADYTESLLLYLARYADVDVVVDGYRPANPAVLEHFRVVDYARFPSLRHTYDACLYHMGNSPFHAYVYDALTRYPGVTVLHDYVLYRFFKAATLDGLLPAALPRAMAYALGRRGFDLAYQALAGVQPFSDFDYALAEPVLDASLGVIVHSAYVRELIARSRPACPVAQINAPVDLPPDPLPDPASLRAELGLPDDAFVVASFGRIDPSKRIDVALRAFARLRETLPEARYLLVGEVVPPYDVAARVRGLGLEGSVVLTGRLALDDFRRYLALPDVCINLRYPTAGETSASLLQMMGAGKPVIVSGVGAFSELPDTCCAKVGVGPGEEDRLVHLLLSLARDAALRRRMGANARQHVLTHHRPDDAARAMVAFVERVCACA